MIRCFILLLYAYGSVGYGYDAGGGDQASCGRPYRTGRVYQPPCDLTRYGYCAQAGQLYPWKAVRRFVRDNQGLMRRMYGDQRQAHVLRAELDDDQETGEEWGQPTKDFNDWKRQQQLRYSRYHHNRNDLDNDLATTFEEDLDMDNPYDDESRYLKDDIANEDVLNTKFVYSEKEQSISIKLAALKPSTHFRPIAAAATTTTSTSRTTPERNKLKSNGISKITKAPLSTTKRYYDIYFGNRRYIKTTTRPATSTATPRSTTIQGASEETSKTVPAESTTLVSASTITTDDIQESTTTSTIDVTDRTSSTLKKEPSTTTENPIGGNKVIASDRIGEDCHNADINDGGAIKNSDTERDTLRQPEGDSAGAVLFQDMLEDEQIAGSKKKIQVNYKLKGVNACPVKEEVVAPFWANNTRGEVLALLNMYPFEQYVHWEKCTFEHRQMYCRDGCRCEQQYRLHRLLAYDPNNECRGIFSDWFRFPSCCICKCYDLPPEFRVTSRSPRLQMTFADEDYQ